MLSESVTIRDLRNKGGEVVERAARGEQITITRAGKPVASLHGLAAPGLTAEMLLARWRHLPRVDAQAWRRDIDEAIDSTI